MRRAMLLYLLSALSAAALLLAPAYAQDADNGNIRPTDASMVVHGDPVYDLAEEAAFSAGLARPFLSGPVSVAAMWQALERIEYASATNDIGLMQTAASFLPTASGPLDVSVRLSASSGYDSFPDRNALSATDKFDGVSQPQDDFVAGGHSFRSPETFAGYLERDPLLDLRLVARSGPVAIDINPELRPSSMVYRLDGAWWSNLAIVAAPEYVDVNVPYRGIASARFGTIEVHGGRDALQLGPGRRSSLGLGYNLPWVDYVSASADFGPLNVSWYLVSLNPVISVDEEQYIMALRQLPPSELASLVDTNALANGLPGMEHQKNLVAARYTWRLAGWLTVALTQYNLVGGRSLELADANPLIIFHNLFQEGAYSVPATLEFSAVPFRGLELYGQFMLYDATFGDEAGVTSSNAGAAAWQLGLTALSTPWLDSGPGRFRLDAEFSRTDPWIYGKYLSWRQFTSRFVFVDPWDGRSWVDYPIGFYLGPDAWELWGRLSYGVPARWNIRVEAAHSVRGSVDLLGYGLSTDYAHKDDFFQNGWVVVRSGEVPEERTRWGLSIDASGRHGLSGSFGAGITIVRGYRWVPGQTIRWMDASCSIRWTF